MATQQVTGQVVDENNTGIPIVSQEQLAALYHGGK